MLVVDDRAGALAASLLDAGHDVRAVCDDVRDERALPVGVRELDSLDAGLAGVDVALLRLPKSLGALEEYAQALAVSLKKSTKTAVSRTIVEGGKAAQPGQKPGVVAARQVNVTAKIDAIDTKTNVVTLTGVEHTVDLKVKDPAVLKNFKVGDFVDAVYAEAIAINVQKPAAKPAPAAPAKK